MLDAQNLKVLAGTNGFKTGLYRINRKGLKLACSLDPHHRLAGARVTKIDDARATELGQSLGVALLIGPLLGAAHALRRRVVVEIELRGGDVIHGTTNSKGYQQLLTYSRVHAGLSSVNCKDSPPSYSPPSKPYKPFLTLEPIQKFSTSRLVTVGLCLSAIWYIFS